MVKQARSKKRYFVVHNDKVLERDIEYDYFGGFASSQKQKCIISLHSEIKKEYPKVKILEVSTKSPNKDLGIRLSAFNLKLDGICIEDIFQTSKVFLDKYGCYKNFYDIKNDIFVLDKIKNEQVKTKKLYHRIKESDFLDTRLKRELNKLYLLLYPDSILDHFYYKNKKYPNHPVTFFYDYIYIKALLENNINISEYDIFTDIEFGKNSINCQARSCAIYNYLYKNNKLNTYINTIETMQSFDKVCFKYIEDFYENIVKKYQNEALF
ncbi:DUF6977 family protein [Campylobacter armoricus]|uniref:DarT1-associated NADAR antitoxin family protein n=1 Tax=Campylobacter armoricus TaxID=2505970 RepID=UPI001116752F|nr:hypothetical protein [Campylobacter armoricus]